MTPIIHRSNILIIVIADVLIAALAGCVSVLRVDPELSTLREIRRVALLPIAEPQQVKVFGLTAPEVVPGIPPAVKNLAHNKINDECGEELLSVMSSSKPSFFARVTNDVVRVLSEDGYEVSVANHQAFTPAPIGGYLISLE